MGTKGEGNRQRIVNAADQLFYQRGYNQTSFQDISDATGIPRGNFYYYFKTKDEILNAVVDSRIEDISGMLSRCESETDNPVERLLLFNDILITNSDNLLQSGCPVGSLSTELAKDSDALQEKSTEIFTLLRQWISQQFEASGLACAEDLSMDLLAKMQGASVMACAFKDMDYIQRSHNEINEWIKSKVVN